MTNGPQQFSPRAVMSLPMARRDGWHLKRYAILADGRVFDEEIALAALDAAIARLPSARHLTDQTGNHGIGFQIIHFAQVAVVSPVFFWQWGSVLASIAQMRAPWDNPTAFEDGVKDVVGCVWEMDIVSFEVNAWKTTMLSDVGTMNDRLKTYFDLRMQSAGSQNTC